MPLNQNKKIKILVLKDFVPFLLILGIVIDLIFLYFFLFNTPERKGVTFLMAKKPVQATEEFLKAIEQKSLSPFSHLNLGLSYDLQNRPLKALEKYKWLSQMFKQFPQFVSYFNSGELNGRLHQIEEALKNYQLALSFNHDVKKIKQNIELLLKKNKSKKKSQQNQKNKKPQNNKDQEKQKPKEKGQKKEDSKSETQKPHEQDKKGDKDQTELTENQKRAILKDIEKQESRVRAKQFRNKSRPRNHNEKDW